MYSKIFFQPFSGVSSHQNIQNVTLPARNKHQSALAEAMTMERLQVVHLYMDMSIMDFAVWNLLPNSIRKWDGFITTHAILFIYVTGSIWHISWNYQEKMVQKLLFLGCNNHFLTKVSPIIRNEQKKQTHLNPIILPRRKSMIINTINQV